MRKWMLLTMFVVAVVVGTAGVSPAIDQAMPGDRAANPHGAMPPATPSDLDLPTEFAGDRTTFEKGVDLHEFRLLAVQHQDQVKIIDSWARQSLTKIRNRSSIDGQDPLFTALDIAFRRDAWADKNIIYIQAIPIRQQLTRFAGGQAEADRIMREGLVSPRFIAREDVMKLLEQMSLDTRQAPAVNKVVAAYSVYFDLAETLALVPPGPSQRGSPWHLPRELFGNVPQNKDEAAQLGIGNVPPIPGYTREQSLQTALAFSQLYVGWRSGDPQFTNHALQSLVAQMPTIDPQAYPSRAKRVTELWYNRTFYGTVANVFLYITAMALFLLVAVGVSNRLHPWAYSIFSVAVLLHFTSMAIRLWLAQRWPTQNQFESVLGAALLGCIVGWILETWKRDGLFGMAFSFVGFLAMTACMAAPYMFGNDLGGAISKTAGILQTYWLYIHVNIVIWSYALIAATFVLGAVYLIIRLWHWINPLDPVAEVDPAFPVDSPIGGGGAAVAVPEATGRVTLSAAAIEQIRSARSSLLSTLDHANMVVLQLSFWFLGTGIICGAVWADHSWGRPWGWDPKETFALVTWIVYLIIVHVRLVLPKAKADTTAVLSIVGFAVMMFNWIFVNYFLVGLHSYA